MKKSSLLVLLCLVIVYLYLCYLTNNTTEKDNITSRRQPSIYAKWNDKAARSHSDIQMFQQHNKQDFEGGSNTILDINKKDNFLGFKGDNIIWNHSSIYDTKTKDLVHKIGNVDILIAIIQSLVLIISVNLY